MAKLKTTRNSASVSKFLDSIKDETKRGDCKKIAKMMEAAIGCVPAMWGPSIVGYGSYHYKYASGREGDMFRIGFSPRVQNITLYIVNGFGRYEKLLSKLGKHSTGKSCLYIKRLTDVDAGVLNQLIVESVKYFDDKYGPNEG